MSNLGVIRPGDTVLVTLAEKTTLELADRLIADLTGRFPDCEFVVLGGVLGIDVYRPNPPPEGT